MVEISLESPNMKYYHLKHFDHRHDHVEFEGALYLSGDSQMLRIQQQLTIAKQ